LHKKAKAILLTFYNTLRSIVWPQEVVEMARVLQGKIQQVLFGKQNYFFSMRKKRQRSKYTCKTFEIKTGQ
jgi:hypothetical protein